MEQDLKQYLDQKFNAVDQKFDGINQKFDGVDQRLDGMDQKFDGVDQRLGQVEKKIDQLDIKIDNNFTKLDIKIDESVESLARIIATTVAEPLQQHIEETRDYPTVRKDIALLKHDVSEIKKVLQIKTL